MISWKIPSLEHPPAPKAPRLLLWFFISIFIGLVGFSFGIYLSSTETLSNNINNSELITLFVAFPIIAIWLIRALTYSIATYRYNIYIEMLDDAKNKWRYWAEKNIGLLTDVRLTQLDENSKQKHLVLSSIPPNKENKLTLNSLEGLSLWEKQEKIIDSLLSPLAEYYHQYEMNQPITFYWQTNDEDTDWEKLIQYNASRLSLPFEKIEVLPYNTFNEWLLSRYDDLSESKLYAILAFQLEPTTTEEATSLLLAPQIVYESLNIPIKAKLLRPISCDIATFSEALKMQFEFQHSEKLIDGIWHANVADKNQGKCVQSYAELNIPKLSEHLYDTNMFLGKESNVRHNVILSLVTEFPRKSLIVYQDNNRFLLQQVQI
ncbi:TPA: hypothetical protein KEY36_000032 [Proteus mirabilis]|nr:hypothetical protein [Proteus mirabilis]